MRHWQNNPVSPERDTTKLSRALVQPYRNRVRSEAVSAKERCLQKQLKVANTATPIHSGTKSFVQFRTVHQEVTSGIYADRRCSANLLNKTNLQQPNITALTGSLGRISSNYDPRIIEFALRLSY